MAASRHERKVKSAKGWITGSVMTVALLASSAATAASLTVTVDQAKPLKLSKEASTVVVGNPSIADAYVQTGKQLVLIGRSLGITNVIAFDNNGDQVTNFSVMIQGNGYQEVSLFRGTDRRTFACASKCEPALKQGDETSFFRDMTSQVEKKSALADAVKQQ